MSDLAEIGWVMSGDLTGRNFTSPSRSVMFGQVRLGLVDLPNWSHTGLNLTNLLRSDLVKTVWVMSGDLTGRNMTSPPRSCLVRLSQVRLSYLIGLILVLTWPIDLGRIWLWLVELCQVDLTGWNMTSPPRLCLVRLGRLSWLVSY